MSNWEVVPVEELCHYIVDCLHSTPVIVDYETGYKMIRTSDIRNGNIEYNTARNVTREVYLERIQRGMPVKGDIIVSREAPLGEVGFINENVRLCLGQRLVHYHVDVEEVNARYLLYAMISPFVKDQFSSYKGSGSVVDNLRMKDAKELKIPLPPRFIQDKIAEILGALDDKIELNRRMNHTLEAMARALFQSWFVDFDPVHAKARGEMPYGMDAATAALFPDSFEETSLGRVPKGWRVSTLGECVSLYKNTINPLKYPAEMFWHYSLPAFDEGRLPKLEAGENIKSNKILLPLGCILLSKLNPKFPKVWIPFNWNNSRSIGSTEFFTVLPKTDFSREYLYGLFTSERFQREFTTLVTGTSSSHQRVKPDYFLDMLSISPSKNLVGKYTDTIAPILQRMLDLSEESNNLASIRDALLPKLVSGEMKSILMREAENIY